MGFLPRLKFRFFRTSSKALPTPKLHVRLRREAGALRKRTMLLPVLVYILYNFHD